MSSQVFFIVFLCVFFLFFFIWSFFGSFCVYMARPHEIMTYETSLGCSDQDGEEAKKLVEQAGWGSPMSRTGKPPGLLKSHVWEPRRGTSPWGPRFERRAKVTSKFSKTLGYWSRLPRFLQVLAEEHQLFFQMLDEKVAFWQSKRPTDDPLGKAIALLRKWTPPANDEALDLVVFYLSFRTMDGKDVTKNEWCSELVCT